MLPWALFQKFSDYMDFVGMSVKMRQNFTMNAPLSPDQAQAVVYRYWNKIKKFGVIKRAKEHQDPIMDSFTRSSYLLMSEIAKEMHISKQDVNNFFRAVIIGISEGKDWIKYINPKLSDEIKKEKEKVNPDPVTEWFEDLKSQAIITGAVVASGLALYLFKR